MITPNDIMTSINELLVSTFPNDKVYVSLLPKDFERPSFAIECLNPKQEAASRYMVRRTMQFVITCFLPEDEHGISDAEALLVRMAQVTDLFRGGFISVSDRALEIMQIDSKSDLFAAEVSIFFEFFDERGGIPQNIDPPIGEVEIKITQG